MWYAIISEDVENSLALRKTAREKHIARLDKLKTEGRLLVAGPHPSLDTETPAEASLTGSLCIQAW